MIPLDGSIPTVLLIWFQAIADAIPTRARTTVMELVFGCMLTGRGHVTQAISAITPRRGWPTYFRMIETGGFSWLDIVHALCRIVRDSFVQQDCCVCRATIKTPRVLSAFGASCATDRLRLPEAVSGGGDQVLQRGHALDVDDSPTGERDGLVDVAGRTQEVADLIKGPAEAMSRIEILEAAHRR